MGIYAPDGSLKVTLTEGGLPVTSTGTGRGVYAPDGSYRVTVVSGGLGSDEAIVQDLDEVTVTTNAGKSVLGDAVVVNNQLSEVNLQSSVALVEDQDSLQIPVTGTYVDTVTFSVDLNGNVTAVVLS
jgi:hypothetical protein